ncbi:hypothetical protein [Sphingobium sp.]|uniref:dUTP diphosphatase n=1 Tax=Sphingobium sp. TaxID=1912891 RepID=UPI002580B8BA|nr:hypothetical protein [Sphingobium sp.]
MGANLTELKEDIKVTSAALRRQPFKWHPSGEVPGFSPVTRAPWLARRRFLSDTSALGERVAAFGGYDRLTSKINFEVNRSSRMGVGLTNNRRESGVRFTQRKWVNLQTPLFHIGFTQTGDLKPDYRGELKVLLINHGADPFPIKRGDRIAQLVVAPVQLASFVEVDMLDDTVRGQGGFGSTGV